MKRQKEKKSSKDLQELSKKVKKLELLIAEKDKKIEELTNKLRSIPLIFSRRIVGPKEEKAEAGKGAEAIIEMHKRT